MITTETYTDAKLSNGIPARIAAALRGPGHLHLAAADTAALAGGTAADWAALADEWNYLSLDRYMADGGTYRLRRYSKLELDTGAGTLTLQPHGPYVQSTSVNYLNGGVDRHFDPCTPQLTGSPVLRGLLTSLGTVYAAVHGATRWDIRLHPYRILAERDTTGQPAPEGRHRDGVTFIHTLMIGRHQIAGGVSRIHDDDGNTLAEVLLTHRGELLLADDLRTTHSVTPVLPAEFFASGHRDVLVIAYTAIDDVR